MTQMMGKHHHPHCLPNVSRGGKFGSMSGGSSLSQSMRYAENWLYCGGRTSLFGTVRSPGARGRPRLCDDPYQAMRRSRLVLGSASVARRSILECDVDPYSLLESSDSGEEVALTQPKRPPRRSKVSPPPPKSILKKEPPLPAPRPPRASFKEYRSRKKKQVQFKMSSEKLEQAQGTVPQSPNILPTVSDGDSSDSSGQTKLRRSLSDLREESLQRAELGGFMDTMRLRQRTPRQHVRAGFLSDGEGELRRRPKEPPPPPPDKRPTPVPPPRQIFPFTKDQINKLNKPPTDDGTRDPPPLPPRDKENSVKVVVPCKSEDNRTIVTVHDSPATSIKINDSTSKTFILGDPKPNPVISSGNKVTISINGYRDEGYESRGGESDYSNSITVNGEESGKTLLVVDHVSELRNILKGEIEMKQLVKKQVDPVEAARNKLVPHICGKMDAQTDISDESGRDTQKSSSELSSDVSTMSDLSEKPYDSSNVSSESDKYDTNQPSDLSDKGYEASNPSSESSDKIYDSETYHDKDKLVDEVEIRLGMDFDNESNHYETIRDPIYEEISDEPPPLPLSPPPTIIEPADELIPTKSIFEGATKYDILNYLAGAKKRGIAADPNILEEESAFASPTHSRLSSLDYASRISQLSNASDSSEESSIIPSSTDISLILPDEKKSNVEVERNDSGVGSETSRSRWQQLSSAREDAQQMCEDCDLTVETQLSQSGVAYSPLVCRKCAKRRTERREIISEIVETEEKYGRDLRILLDEFYRPMLVAGLLTQEQLGSIFLNAEELVEHNLSLSEKLRDSLEIAVDQGDEDFLTVNVGSIFLHASPMLHAFQSYCTRQGSAALLLSNLEKEKELLRIFLRVSQMENSVLRRMNLNSFLMVPVQRVTKYPLLLSRLYKVTPVHIVGREAIRQAQEHIALHLEHINYLTKDMSSTKIWRKISVMNGKKSSSESDMANIKLRKIAVEVLEWSQDEVRFSIEGKLLFMQPADANWKKRASLKLHPVNALLVTLDKEGNSGAGTNEEAGVTSRWQGEASPLFPKPCTVKEASLVLIREKGGRYSLVREPLFLDRCIVCVESDVEDYFEIQELSTKDTYIFKAEDNDSTKKWYKELQFHAQGLGTWRKRRNALANIMINGMLLRS